LTTAVSHDNVSHTLLGLQDVATRTYRPELDLLRACRKPAG
jgi:lipid A ethanolaminephosphotransferase